LQGPLSDLATVTHAAFEWLAVAVTGPELPAAAPPNLRQALREVETVYDSLRESRACSSFPAEEVLRFCTFFFNLKAVTRGLRAMVVTLAHSCSGQTDESKSPDPNWPDGIGLQRRLITEVERIN
jgi:hypothetical protein